ncbi:hypothetical protein [Nocardioides perillae]|uniref:Uncharacterized protein n=1 Tax=Nocardioides perillae TaxID=1119534 RepID=A0A7Y9UL30_9ACTN|nr:hypothetical protein [Nocardioides perillae]NYG54597.1 hypothetical protein [Nocardioides perillae]
MLPPFESVHRLRTVEPLGPHGVQVDEVSPRSGARWAVPLPAPYAAVVVDLPPDGDGAVGIELRSGPVRLSGTLDAAGRTALAVATGRGGADGASTHRSRRHGRARERPRRVALTLTGAVLACSTDATGADDGSGWRVRARVDLQALPRPLDLGHPGTCAGLEVHLVAGTVERLRAGAAGHWGLRDVRAVTQADGTPLRDGRRVPLTATCAGPGFADAAHCGTFLLDPVAGSLVRTGSLFTTRAGDDRVHGDHATHLLRAPDDADAWLVATSTWGGFVAGRSGARVDATLGHLRGDALHGTHVVPTTALRLPVDDLASVGTWDPHLVRRDAGWEVGFVSARRYFDFHPAWATGPTLDALVLRGADRSRTATEGTTLVDLGPDLGLDLGPDLGAAHGGLRLLASDGRDGPRERRARFPVLDEQLHEVGALDAAYASNIPWPTLLPARADRDGHDGWWLVTFDGTPSGGRLPGYGTHGDLLVLRARAGGRAAP